MARNQPSGRSRDQRGREGQRGGRDRDRDRDRDRRGPGAQGRPPRAEGARERHRDARPSGDVIEGRRAVAEALEASVPLRKALVAKASGEEDPTLEKLVRRLEGSGVECERVPKAVLDAASSHGAHQGIIVRTRPFEYAGLADVIAAAGSGDALVVVLDHVTDEGNFGAIVRSAEVVGAAGVVIANARAATVGVGAYKTSAGAVLHIPIAQVPNLARALEDLKSAGFWACAASEHAEQDVWHAPLGGRLALVMGSEGSGVSRLMLEKCDFSCRLPQRGRVESLNVAQAATVLCYEWLRRVSGESDDGR